MHIRAMAHLDNVWRELAKIFGFLKILEPLYNFLGREWQIVFSKDAVISLIPCTFLMALIYLPLNLVGIVAKTE